MRSHDICPFYEWKGVFRISGPKYARATPCFTLQCGGQIDEVKGKFQFLSLRIDFSDPCRTPLACRWWKSTFLHWATRDDEDNEARLQTHSKNVSHHRRKTSTICSKAHKVWLQKTYRVGLQGIQTFKGVSCPLLWNWLPWQPSDWLEHTDFTNISESLPS